MSWSTGDSRNVLLNDISGDVETAAREEQQCPLNSIRAVVERSNPAKANAISSKSDFDPIPVATPDQLGASRHIDVPRMESLTELDHTPAEAQEDLITRGKLAGHEDSRKPEVTEKDQESLGKLLRCPYFFTNQTKRCFSVHNFIRDLIRHLESHGFYFCAKCAQNFSDQKQKRQHSCDHRLCLDVHCPNRHADARAHDWLHGCRFSFNSLGTPEKWNALCALQFPSLTLPTWDTVLVTEDSRTQRKTIENVEERMQMTSISTTTSGSANACERKASTAVALPVVLNSGQCTERDILKMDVSKIDETDSIIFQHALNQALIRGSITQTRIIMEHGKEHERQSVTNQSHDDQLQDIRNKLMELRNAFFAPVDQQALERARMYRPNNAGSCDGLK